MKRLQTFVFDLDETLCESNGNYLASVPNKERITRVNQLRSEGAKIVIYTARGMSTFKGFSFLAKLRWQYHTGRQLKLWGLQFDKLILGKPSGDVYVDDKAINSEVFFGSSHKPDLM